MKERIRKLRRTLDLTQQSFGERIGIKRNTVANYETGRNEPVASVISLICREFNVSEKWLRTGEGEMFQSTQKNELDALIKRYNLTAADKFLIENYLELKPDSKKAIIDFIMNIATKVDSSPNTNTDISLNDIYNSIPDTPEELERQFPPVEIENKKLG